MKNLTRLFLITVFLSFTSCSSNKNHEKIDSLESIKKERKIRVGYISYFDITYKDPETGEIKGFLVDILYEVINKLNISKDNVTFIETDWQNFGLGLSTGKYDLCIAGTFKTPVREKSVNFSMPIFYLGNGAIVRKDDTRFNCIEDFNRDDIVIAVVQGEQGYEYAKKNLWKAKLHALAGSDLSIAPLEVKLGKADAALSDQYILRRYSDSNPEVKDALADSPYDVLPICWSVSKNSKDTSLLSFVNKQIISLEKSGKIGEIIDMYPMIPFAAKIQD